MNTKKLNLKPTKDLLNNKYVSPNVDSIWTLDFTAFGRKKQRYWTLTLMDLASRRILLHRVVRSDGCSFKEKDVIMLVNEAILVNQRPQVIHTDMGGQFIGEELATFLKKQDIKQSLADQVRQKFPNQVHESSNKTLKKILSDILKTKKIKSIDHIENQETAIALISEVISTYNNKPHSKLVQASPNISNNALALNNDLILQRLQKTQCNNQKPFILAKAGTDLGDQIETIKTEVIQRYAGDWQTFFTEWREQQEQDTQHIIEEIRESAKSTIETLQGQLQEQLSQLQEQLSQIQYLKSREEDRARKEKEAEEKKQIRKLRERRPARDAATCPEFLNAIATVEATKNRSQFCAARDKIALLLLYLFGMRIGNLSLITAGHLQQILKQKQVLLPLIKTKKPVYKNFYISESMKQLIIKLESSFQILLGDRKDEQLVFTQTYDSEKTLSRITLTGRINKILKESSKASHKKLSSHSFRIGLTTALIETAGIDIAQAMIGHKDIATTAVYSRRTFDAKQANDIMEAATKHQQQYVKKKYKKKEQ